MEKYIEYFSKEFKKEYDISILSLSLINENTIFSKYKLYTILESRLYFISNKIARICNTNKFDISISHWDYANLLNILSKFFFNKAKIIIIMHNAFDKKITWISFYYLCKFLYKYADEIITVSHELSNDVKMQINTDNIKTIYNPFDFEKINILKHEKIEENILKIINNWNINFCHIARLDLNKKQDFLLECFEKYSEKYNNKNNLFIIWDWNYRTSLENQIKSLKMKNNIYLLWHKDNVYKYLNKMNYFLYSSCSEGFWRTLIDAVSLWIPVLTHDYKYWAKEIIRNNKDFKHCIEIEKHENGILSPYMDKEKYIEWINLLLNTKFDKEKIIENTKKYDIENFKNAWNLILK